ncbi:MAG TPA: KUP/HAK/KT family potassium transporter [Thermoanaerobaculia bacterium]
MLRLRRRWPSRRCCWRSSRAFFGANIVMQGGWFPLLVGVTVFALMTTWRRGRIILTQRVTETAISEEDFLRDLAAVRAGSASSA